MCICLCLCLCICICICICICKCYSVLSCIKHDQTCAAVQDDAKVLEKETDNMKATEAGEIDSQLAISL